MKKIYKRPSVMVVRVQAKLLSNASIIYGVNDYNGLAIQSRGENDYWDDDEDYERDDDYDY
jgi:hypothetical protein